MSGSILESSTKEVSVNVHVTGSTFILNKLETDHKRGHTATATNNKYSNLRSCYKNENYEPQVDIHNQIYQKAEDTYSGISVQKNDAYGLVLTNTQISSSTTDLANECVTSPSIVISNPQVYTTESTPKDRHSSTFETRAPFHAIEPSHLHTTVENTHDESDSEHQPYEKVCTYERVQLNATEFSHLLCTTSEDAPDHESDSEHQSYEQVCTYEKVQACNVQQLLHLTEETPHQGPSVYKEASKKLSNDDDSASTTCTGGDDKTETKSLDSYECVWGYEKIDHCDLDLEKIIVQKFNDNKTQADSN